MPSEPRERVSYSPHFTQLRYTLDLIYRTCASRIPQSLAEGPDGINGHAYTFGLSAFVLAATIWESVINFCFFSVWTRIYFGDSVAKRCENLEVDLERLSILEKTIVMPQIAFERTFDKSAEPFQSLKMLISIRNDITHDHPNQSPEKEIQFLRGRGLLLELPTSVGELQAITWQNEISTLESIRWAINLLPELVEELRRLSGAPADKLPIFPKLTVEEARQLIGAPFKLPPPFGPKD